MDIWAEIDFQPFNQSLAEERKRGWRDNGSHERWHCSLSSAASDVVGVAMAFGHPIYEEVQAMPFLVLARDGIGPEITEGAMAVPQAADAQFGVDSEYVRKITNSPKRVFLQ